NFEDLGISESNILALKRQNIYNPTPVQKKAIPLIINGHHLMTQSKTGSGKTLAFVLPIIEQLQYKNNEALILAPTRELAKQTNKVIKDLGNGQLKSMTIYGGVSISNQIKKIVQGVNIIVGTPGRIIDLYKRKKLSFRNIRFVVLDEADRLWDMGFAPDVKYILSRIRTDYQFMLFSATLDYDMRKLVKKYTKNKFEFLNLSRDNLTVGNTTQVYYLIERFEEKFSTFIQVLKIEKPKHVLVFVNTKKTASWLEKKLRSYRGMNFKIGIISGNLSQFQREKILTDFRNRNVNLLIATDVAARGLDIENVSHVINYDIPKFPENYIHRIGRTSRMNKKGVAITLCLKDEYEYLCHIEGLIDKEIQLRTIKREEKKYYHNPFY
ncbi:MAG: DEAD/DEAH box helicase, partial [Candidatus Thorarchaeota archaeon]